MADLILTPEQLQAIDFVCDRLKSGQKVLAIRGLAGTGKSALILPLKKAIERTQQTRVDVGAPTNRAAMVLRTRGLMQADTVHSLALQPLFLEEYNDALSMVDPNPPGDDTPVAYDDEGDTLLGAARRAWPSDEAPFPSRKDLRHRAGLYTPRKALRSVGINGRDYLCGYGPKSNHEKVLILDEGSMVGAELLALCQQSYSAVVVLGDPGQLPPIKDVSVLATLEGITLNEIHRQAEGSGILRLAYAARNGTVRWNGDMRAYAPEVLSVPYAPALRLIDAPVIVWRNAIRVENTRAIRAALGYPPDQLVAGEPLVCRSTERNDRVDGLYNNAMFRVQTVASWTSRHLKIAPEGEPENVQWADVHLEELDGPYVEPGSIPFRFGYCLTAHTAQGGEWPLVVIDAQDLRAHRGMCWHRGNMDESAQWAYTAITRATERLILLQERVFC